MPLGAYTRPVTAELDVTAAVVLNSQGAGFVTLAPQGLDAWRVTQAHLSTTTGPTDSSQAFGFRAAIEQHRQLFETAQGGGDSLNFMAVIRAGDTIIVLWQGGNPGDTATVNLTGTNTTRIPG